MWSSTAHESYAFQEEKHFSSFTSRRESGDAVTFPGGDSSSRAIHGGGHTFQAIRDGGSVVSGEDEDKFAFNFPGPNATPLHASDGSQFESQSRKKAIHVRDDDDFNSRAREGISQVSKEHPKQWGSMAKSKVAEENYVFTNNSSSRQAKEKRLGNGNTIISSSNNSINNWTLSPTEPPKGNVFTPQQSSTMINKSNSKVASVTSATSSKSAATISRSSRPEVATSTTGGDRIVYERIPVSHETSYQRIQGSEHAQQRQDPTKNYIVKSEQLYQENAAGRHPQGGAPRHVSSLTVGGKSSGHLWHSSKSSSVASTNSMSHANSKGSIPPGEKGEYTIEVKFADQEVSGSPFVTKAFDMRKLVISEMPSTATRDKPVSFNIDASQAGSGNIEIRVNEGRVPCDVQNKGNHRFTGSFVPENTRPHIVEISFNDTPVIGSPWTINIVDRKAVTIKAKERVPCNKTATVHIHSSGQNLAHDDIDVTIKGPEGENVPCKMSDSNGDKIVKYTPTDVGNYVIHVKYSDHEVSGSPFVAKAFNIGAIIVTPPHDGFVNQPMYFTIDVGDAGEGHIEIMVNKGSIPNEFEAQRPGYYRVKFIPAVSGQQVVDIFFNGVALPCCPLTCHANDLSAHVVGLNHLVPVKAASSFRVQSQASMEAVTTEVFITAPNGENIPARLVQQPDGDYKVEWTPHKPGRHSVDVLFGGQQIQGSPFHIDVFDIQKIRVNKFFQGNVNEKAGFELDCTQAGSGTQEIRIQSPSGHTVPFRVQEAPSLVHHVTYTPTEVGLHTINVSYSGMDLNGSPFHQEIGEGALPTAHGEGLHKGEEDKPAYFTIDARNLKGTPSVQVDGPNAIAKCSIDPHPDGQYKVTYIPVEVGLFDVYVRWNDREIPGSPFHPKVVDSRKVKVIGGWQHYMDGQERIHLVVGEEKKIPFDTSEAGPGHLRAEVKSPSSLLPVDVDDAHKGKSVVRFTPKEEGNHYIYLHWSDQPLVNSPYLGYATGGSADPSKVWLSGRGLKEAIIKEEAEFTIDGSQAGPGEPDVQLTGVRAEVQVITTPLGGGKFRCTYIPVIPGAYLLNISWNGRQLRGAPYKVNVIGASYPDRVVVNGDGLKGGLLGQSLNFRIDTRKAGPGELTAYCTGPNKVAYCELKDHHDGIYSLVIRPQETGRHTVQIKYGGEHVQGSPFTFKISGQPDASKVRVSGPGVEHGILANFQSQFIVETRGAGAGQLTVRIRGPKGAFQVEMYRESQKDRTILCRYYPSVTGLYIISVRWSDVDVPGSPFHVHILDTQQELEQVLNESSFSGSGHQHHLANPSSSFYNTSMNRANHVQYSTNQNGHHHNVSRNSSYYQYN